MSKKRYEKIQSMLLNCGNYGCHFLVLLSIAEESTNKKVDLIDAIKTCTERNWIKTDFYVNDAIAILEYFTNSKWTRSKKRKSLPLKIMENEYTEVVYYNKKTGFTHFRRRGFDTLVDSNTVKNGKIIGYYIYTKIG